MQLLSSKFFKKDDQDVVTEHKVLKDVPAEESEQFLLLSYSDGCLFVDDPLFRVLCDVFI